MGSFELPWSSEEGPQPGLGGQGRFPRRNEVLSIRPSVFVCHDYFVENQASQIIECGGGKSGPLLGLAAVYVVILPD